MQVHVTVHSQLSNRNESRHITVLPIKLRNFQSKVKLVQGRQILRAAYPKDKLEFMFVQLKPACALPL